MNDRLDVYIWKMSAAAHAASVNSLREDLIQSHANGDPIPIQLIADLLPLQSDQLPEATARGEFQLDGDHFINRADSELWMEFSDPVMQTFSATVPAVWSGTMIVDDGQIEITFDNVIELEIPRLEELGVQRSVFQQVVSIHVGPLKSRTVLKDAQAGHKQTWIDAYLDDNVEDPERPEALANVVNVSSFDTRQSCGPDPDDPDWYVYSRSGLCIIHYGQIIVGGQVAYVYRFGPATRTECQSWVDGNCQGDLC